MKISSVTTMIVSLAAIMLFASGASAQAGHTVGQLERAGYDCSIVGPAPNFFRHCLLPRHGGNPVIPVMVFSNDGMTFKGTELLLREDIYAGQPCPQDGGDPWVFLVDPPYFACHHFNTGHH